jgi:uncharacterized protein (DUF885 family)
MKKHFIFFLFFIFFGCQKGSSKKEFLNLINQFENYKTNSKDEFPLGDFREEAFEKYAFFCSNLLNDLSEININDLSEDEKISLELLYFVLESKKTNYKFKTHWNPILSDNGFHLSLTYRVRPINSKKAAIDYLKTLKSIPKYIDQQIVLIRKGLDLGIGQPLVIFKGYESTYEKHITETAEENFYYSPFLNLPKSIGNKAIDSLQKAGIKIVEKMVIPSFINVKTFFEEEYFLKTRKKIGVSETPNGIDYYNSRIKFYTTLELSPKKIHETGLKEVQRIKKKMLEIISDLDFNGDLNSFILFLRTDSRFYTDSPEYLLMNARNIAKKLDEQLPRYFKTLPRKTYEVAPVPESIAPKYTAGRYIGANPESTDPGYYWVNTYNLPSRPLYAYPSLTAHEAVPGHHLQGALNGELSDLIPKFRRDLYLSAFGEGWGLYSEYLAEEMGIYTTPYEHFGKLSYEMWRACRLVIDTGIHAFGWSRDEAFNFMKLNTALSIHEINTEIDRYISWPGQALAYKIGELKIRSLREKVEIAKGVKFDIREFHELILEKGTVTLSILEKRVNNYLNN